MSLLLDLYGLFKRKVVEAGIFTHGLPMWQQPHEVVRISTTVRIPLTGSVTPLRAYGGSTTAVHAITSTGTSTLSGRSSTSRHSLGATCRSRTFHKSELRGDLATLLLVLEDEDRRRVV